MYIQLLTAKRTYKECFVSFYWSSNTKYFITKVNKKRKH
jgi:hypothetical protein